ncbi:MAG: acetylornithine deacetylase [Hyphomicrobiaceae bacterium]
MTATAATDILGKLVSFDTTSRNSNIPIIEYIESYLSAHEVESSRVPDDSGEKSSLYATIGPDDVSGVGLSGHTDVVPVDGQDWDTDPFEMTEKSDRLYGRGTCDMKGFLACMMAAVPDFKRRNLKTPIHLLFSYDEEVGCTGVRPMIGEFGERLIKPRMVIVGEPTNMNVVEAHKGGLRWEVTITGRPVHSSMAPLGVNSISIAGELLAELAKMEEELKTANVDQRFDPPYSTLQITQINGGVASNIVPAETWFGWEIRGLPGVDPEVYGGRFRQKAAELQNKMREVAPEAAIEIRHSSEIPAFSADPSSEVLSLALKLVAQNETFAVSYGTEASLFHHAGSQSVVCGPGDIAQAHTPNEWIEKIELEKCMAFLDKLATWAEQ